MTTTGVFSHLVRPFEMVRVREREQETGKEGKRERGKERKKSDMADGEMDYGTVEEE